MSESPVEGNRVSSDSSWMPSLPSSRGEEEATDSSHVQSSPSSEREEEVTDSIRVESPPSSDREEEVMWERSLELSLTALSDTSICIMQEDLESNFERMHEALNGVINTAAEAQQVGWKPVPQLQQIKLQLRNYLTTCKNYGRACKALGKYLSSQQFTTGLKNAVQQENITEIINYLDIVDDLLQTCNQHSAQMELDFPKLSPVLQKAISSTDKGLLNRRTKAGDNAAKVGASSTTIMAFVAVVGFSVDPLITGPVILAGVGSGFLIAGIIALPFLVRYARLRKRENQALKRLMAELKNLDLSMQKINELISSLRGSVDRHNNHLRLLRTVRRGETAPQTEPSKDYICRNIDSLQAAMENMARKATNISRMEIPPQLIRA